MCNKRTLILFTCLFVLLFLLTACGRTPDLGDVDTPEGEGAGGGSIPSVEVEEESFLDPSDYTDPGFDLVSDFSLGDYSQSVQSSGATLISDIPYASDDVTVFDVFYKEEYLLSGDAPIVFLVHGGNELPGKTRLHHMHDLYTDLGFVAVFMNYRYDPEDLHHGFSEIHDVACSIATFKEIAHEFGANPDEVYLHGFSHGGYVSSFLAVSNHIDLLQHCPVQDPNVIKFDGYIAHSANNFGALIPEGETPVFAVDDIVIEGPSKLVSELREKYNVVLVKDGAFNHIDAGDTANVPKVQFIYGAQDPKLNLEEIEEMRALLEEVGIVTTLHIEPGAAHGPENYEPGVLEGIVADFTGR